MANKLSGKITVTTAGTAVAGPTAVDGFRVLLRADPANTQTVWFGNDGAGDVTTANGYPLEAAERGVEIWLDTARKLAEYWFDSEVSGEGFRWAVISSRY